MLVTEKLDVTSYMKVDPDKPPSIKDLKDQIELWMVRAQMAFEQRNSELAARRFIESFCGNAGWPRHLQNHRKVQMCCLDRCPMLHKRNMIHFRFLADQMNQIRIHQLDDNHCEKTAAG